MNPEEIQAIDKAQKERRNHIDNKTAKVEQYRKDQRF